MGETTAVTVTRHLPVKIDQYRERQLHNQMVTARMEEVRTSDQLKSISDSLKDLIKTAQKKQTDAARALDAGFEHQSVSCENRPDLEKNTMRLVRLDTLETVEERALTVEEAKALRKKATV